MKLRFVCLILTLALLMSACQPTSAPTAVSPTTGDAEILLEVAGTTETKTFTLEELKALPATEGYAGTKSSTGKITLPELYKGVLLTDLLAQVGGIDPTMAIQIEAKDGYAMTFSPEQVTNGNFIAYDPGTGDEISDAGSLQVLIAYERNGEPFDAEQDGTLRLMIIGDETNQVTDGHWSIKWVRRISLKPLAADWVLHLEGAITEEMDRATFESGTNERCHEATWKDDHAQTWTGIALWLLAGRVDDENKHETGAYSDELADQGYTIEVIAADGYSVTFDSARVKRNDNMILAHLVNGNPLTDKDFPLRLVGSDVADEESIGAVTQIVLHFDQKPEAAEPTATPEPAVEPTAPVAAQPIDPNAAFAITGLVSEQKGWTVEALQAMGPVKLTVEHPKKGAQDVEGIRLNALLGLAGPQAAAKTLVLTAEDGYTIEADLEAVRACPDCLVALDEEGLKAVMPGFESGFWVKDIISVEVK